MKSLSTLLACLLSTTLFATDYVVEFKKPISTKKLQQLQKTLDIELFDNFNSDYFKRAYKLSSDLSQEKLLSLLAKSTQVVAIESVDKIEALSINPANEQTRFKIEDQLFPYQWGLVSQGQTVRKDKDDINYVLLKDDAISTSATPDWLALLGDQASQLPPEVLANLLAQQKPQKDFADINYVGFKKAIGDLELKEIKVAVIDSGIDFGHPELKNMVSKNMAECNADGGTNYESRDDLDDNGVPGDCLGWNFTVHKNDPRAKLPMDDAGHGTHVAGIIAAEIKNGFGVAGLGNNIKIVPVKVLHSDESSPEAKQIAFTDRVARGILYAIKRDVDVINLSLGWLRQSDTKYLREAINAALARGIPVIAAAGNNSSQARLYPCSYPGVICVGASTIEGKIADFSNRGGNVDLFAPGESILSTWPVTTVPLEFSVHGYEIQSGTSQAAPYVSGAIAQLKAVKENIKLSEIQARLLLSANNDLLKDQPQLGGAGRLDMEKLLSVQAQSAVVPVFKSLDEISYTLRDRKFRFPLPIVNYWSDAENIIIKVSSENKGIELARSEFPIARIENEKSKTIPIEGRIVNLKADRSVELKIEISESGKTKSFYHTVNFVRLLIDDPNVEERTITFLDKPKPLALVQEGVLQPLVTTLESFYGTSEPEWFLRRNLEKAVEFSFFSLSEQSILETKGFTLDRAKRVLSINSLDFNNDGIDDRLVRSTRVNDEDVEDAIVYSFRSKLGEPLYGDYSDWTLIPDVAVANDSLAYISSKLADLENIPAPVFVAQGTLPESQQPSGFFDRRDEANRKRIYVLLPKIDNDKKVILETLSVDTQENIAKWKETLGLRWSDKLEVVSLLAPTLAEHNAKTVRVLLSGGHASRRVDAIVTIRSIDDVNIEKTTTNGIRFENQEAVRISEIEEDRFARHERTGFVGFYDGKRARTSVIDDSIINQTYKISDEFDNFSGHIGSFLSQDQLTSVYSTSHKLVLVQQADGKQTVLERPLERFDFLPGQVFNELFWPIARLNDLGELIPSLYVDTSSIHTNSIHIIEINKNKINAPMEQSVLLPPNCKALNPVILTNEKAHRTSLICVEKDRGFIFKFVK